MKPTIYAFSILSFAAVLTSASVSAQYISTFAGNGFGAGSSIGGYSGDGGTAVSAKLNGCTGVAFDGAGNVYIADRGNNVVRKVNTAGVISTFAGTGVAGNTGDGGNAALAKLNAPSAVATDAAGNVYIADNGNHTVRMVNPAGVISVFAGSGTAGYSGNGGPAILATLNDPQGMAFDVAGNLYIAEAGNNVIRKVDPTHIITTYAGNGTQGNSGDGGMATAAQLYGPSGVATDVAGNVYVADYYNNVIRKVSSTGIITRIAGTGVAGNSGDGGAALSATLNFPASVSVDGAGTIYIADQGNNNIRAISTGGIISRVAGSSINGYDGNGGLAASAKLSSPKCVAADGWNRVYIADYNNHVIRIITPTPSATLQIAGNIGFSIYPNPTTGFITVNMPTNVTEATINVIDLTGKVIAAQNINGAAKSQLLNMGTLPQGTYVVSMNANGNIYTQTLTVLAQN